MSSRAGARGNHVVCRIAGGPVAGPTGVVAWGRVASQGCIKPGGGAWGLVTWFESIEFSRGFFQSPDDGTKMTEPTPTGRFEWLREKVHRRDALRKVYNALLSGWAVDGDGRADLVRELNALLGADDLSERERVRIARIFQALEAGSPHCPRRLRVVASDRF